MFTPMAHPSGAGAVQPRGGAAARDDPVEGRRPLHHLNKSRTGSTRRGENVRTGSKKREAGEATS